MADPGKAWFDFTITQHIARAIARSETGREDAFPGKMATAMDVLDALRTMVVIVDPHTAAAVQPAAALIELSQNADAFAGTAMARAKVYRDQGDEGSARNEDGQVMALQAIRNLALMRAVSLQKGL